MRSPLALMCCSALLASGVLPLGTLHSQGASASRKDSSADPLSLDLATIRTQYRALRRLRLTLEWYSRTQGETPVTELLYLGRERLFSPAALAVVDSARRRPGLSSDEALGLRFLRRRLAGEHVSLQAARFDDAAGAASTDAVVRVSFDSQPIPYLDLPLRQAAESNAARRAQLATAAARVMLETLNPILRQKHAAAQAAARAVGYRDYVAMSEDLRDVALDSLLASGVAYLTETDAIYKRTLDRVAREEVGVGLDGMRVVNFGRIFLSPTVARLFRKELQLPAVNMFLAGIGLDLRTARGGEVRVDDSLHPKKVPRAFVASVDPPADVRLSVKPQDGMGYLGTLLHETGHAVHFARSTVEPFETRVLGAGAASEAFGEFFRTALEDPPFLERYRAFLVARGEKAPTNAELASVMRRITLQQLYYTRRYAFAKLLYELRLHGRPASEVRHALARLPAPAKVMGDDEASLRELYGQAHSAAFGFTLNADETASFRSDVDDTFYSADYARAFVLSRMMHDAMRRKFGADWYGNPEVGRFLTRELFSRGNSLSAEDVAERLGMARRLDFSLAARRARAALASADSLERAR